MVTALLSQSEYVGSDRNELWIIISNSVLFNLTHTVTFMGILPILRLQMAGI